MLLTMSLLSLSWNILMFSDLTDQLLLVLLLPICYDFDAVVAFFVVNAINMDWFIIFIASMFSDFASKIFCLCFLFCDCFFHSLLSIYACFRYFSATNVLCYCWILLSLFFDILWFLRSIVSVLLLTIILKAAVYDFSAGTDFSIICFICSFGSVFCWCQCLMFLLIILIYILRPFWPINIYLIFSFQFLLLSICYDVVAVANFLIVFHPFLKDNSFTMVPTFFMKSYYFF